jgi:hypothetical protein
MLPLDLHFDSSLPGADRVFEAVPRQLEPVQAVDVLVRRAVIADDSDPVQNGVVVETRGLADDVDETEMTEQVGELVGFLRNRLDGNLDLSSSLAVVAASLRRSFEAQRGQRLVGGGADPERAACRRRSSSVVSKYESTMSKRSDAPSVRDASSTGTTGGAFPR